MPHFASRFAELCADLAAYDVPETIQHDDLHHANLYVQDSSTRVLDWGDASHPFASLVVRASRRTRWIGGRVFPASTPTAYREGWLPE